MNRSPTSNIGLGVKTCSPPNQILTIQKVSTCSSIMQFCYSVLGIFTIMKAYSELINPVGVGGYKMPALFSDGYCSMKKGSGDPIPDSL